MTLTDFPPGARDLLIVADGSREQAELDESNNLLAMPITLHAADLVVPTVSIDQAAPRSGEDLTVRWTVTNQGDGAVSSPFQDRVVVRNTITDDVLFDQSFAFDPATQGGPIAAGGSRDRQATVRLPGGPRSVGVLRVTVTTDAFNAVAEYHAGSPSNDNNIGTASVTSTLAPYPDLAVTDIVAPIEARSGQVIPVSWTITNHGDKAAVGTWVDSVYLSADSAVGNDQFFADFPFTGTLSPGQSVTRTQSITLPIDLQGDRRVVVRIDSGNVLYEVNEADNAAIDDRKVLVKLAPFPNLQVTAITPPDSAFSSQPTTISWTVTNTGDGPTSAPNWSDGVWLSVDPTLDDTDTFLGYAPNASYLNPGESYTNSLVATLPRGISGN